MYEVLAKSWDRLTEREREDMVKAVLEARVSPCGFGL